MTKNNNTLHFNYKKFSVFLTLLLSMGLATSIIDGRLALSQESIAKGEPDNLQPKLETIQQKNNLLKEGDKNKSLKITSSQAQAIIERRAKDVLLAIRNKDMSKLASFIHSEKGVRFSADSYVNRNSDRVFYRPQIPKLLTENKKYVWGVYPGSGMPIQMTPRQYFNSFVYDQDFANAKQIGYNQVLGLGNSRNNSFEVYPKAIIVEYYFPGFEPKYKGMDWKSLRLVFEEKGNNWYLVGIIHAQWTI